MLLSWWCYVVVFVNYVETAQIHFLKNLSSAFLSNLSKNIMSNFHMFRKIFVNIPRHFLFKSRFNHQNLAKGKVLLWEKLYFKLYNSSALPFFRLSLLLFAEYKVYKSGEYLSPKKYYQPAWKAWGCERCLLLTFSNLSLPFFTFPSKVQKFCTVGQISGEQVYYLRLSP